MQQVDRPPGTHVAAAVLLGLKGLLGLWAAVVLLSASATRPHTFLGQAVRRRAGGLAVVLLFVVALTVVIIVGLLQARQWAPASTYVLEGLAVLLGLSRIGARPRAAVLSLVLSATIVALVVAGARRGSTSPSV